VTGLTYDSGALIAAERKDHRMWAVHKKALSRGVLPVVPAGVVTEVHRSGRQARLAQLLVGCQIEALGETAAKAAGVMLGRCAIDPGAVDASVAESALRRGDSVVTGNPEHIQALAAAINRNLDIIRI
jgi:predicted nucleic acid-binding protein